jgi:hypothetical protein
LLLLLLLVVRAAAATAAAATATAATAVELLLLIILRACSLSVRFDRWDAGDMSRNSGLCQCAIIMNHTASPPHLRGTWWQQPAAAATMPLLLPLL